MSVWAIVQARMGSARLPGKVLADLAGEPMLAHIMRRAAAVEGIDGVVLAVPATDADQVLVDLAKKHGWTCHAGSLDDVLDRYTQAARQVKADHILRVTADSPLLCFREASRVVRRHLETGAAVTHNVTAFGTGMPVGTACEVFTVAGLEASWREGRKPHHREHVDEFLFEHPERFRIEQVAAPDALRRPTYRVTVDTPEDLELVRRIYAALYRPGSLVEVDAVVALLDRQPELLELNKHVQQKPV